MGLFLFILSAIVFVLIAACTPLAILVGAALYTGWSLTFEEERGAWQKAVRAVWFMATLFALTGLFIVAFTGADFLEIVRLAAIVVATAPALVAIYSEPRSALLPALFELALSAAFWMYLSWVAVAVITVVAYVVLGMRSVPIYRRVRNELVTGEISGPPHNAMYWVGWAMLFLCWALLCDLAILAGMPLPDYSIFDSSS